MTDLAIVARSMRARLFSTVTTVAMVAVAVALLLVLLGMRESGRAAFERGAGNMHLLVSADDSPLVSVLNGVFYAGVPKAPLPWAKVQEISGSFPLDFAVPIVHSDNFRGYPVVATTPEFFTAFRPDPAEPWRLEAGAFFDGDIQVVVGARVARALRLELGDQVLLTHGLTYTPGVDDIRRPAEGEADHDGHDHADEHAHADDHGHADEPDHGYDDAGHDDTGHAGAHVHDDLAFEVVGILAPTGTPHDRAVFISLQSSWLMHAQDRLEKADPGFDRTATAEDLTDADRLVTGIYLRGRTRPGSDVSPVLPRIFERLRRDPSVTVASPSTEVQTLFEIVSNVDRILVAMAAVVMVASGLSITLALYNSMDQRRRQIAILRVLGYSRWRVFGITLAEAGLIGLAGAAAGWVLHAGAIRVVSVVMRAELGLVIEPQLWGWWTAAVVGGAALLSAAAGLMPAAMAYRTPVAHHLSPTA